MAACSDVCRKAETYYGVRKCGNACHMRSPGEPEMEDVYLGREEARKVIDLS